MTVLTISQDTLIQLPDGATGGAVKLSYNGTTVGPVIASGDDQGRAVIVQGRLAKLTALDGKSPLKVVGREAGGRLPARITISVYPEYPAGVTPPHALVPLMLTGLPVGSPDAPGIWDLSNIGDASGGMDVILPGERQALAVLRERGVQAAERAEVAAAVARAAEEAAAEAIANLGSRVDSAAQQAAAGTVARVDKALADTAQTSSQLTQQQEANNAATAMNIGRRTALKIGLIGAAVGLYNIVSGQEAGQVWERTDSGDLLRRPELEAATTTQLRQVQDNLQLTRADLLTGTAGVGRGDVKQVLADGSVFSIEPKVAQRPDTGIIFDWTPDHIAKRNYSGAVDARWFGVTYDNTDRGRELQDAIDATPEGGVLYVAGRYLSSVTHHVNKRLSIVGDDPAGSVGVYLDGVNGWEITPGIPFTMQQLAITCYPYFYIAPPGKLPAVGLRSAAADDTQTHKHLLENIKIDGFETSALFSNMWDSRLVNVRTLRTKVGIDIYGKSVNNVIRDPSLLVETMYGSRAIRMQGIRYSNGEYVGAEGLLIQGGLTYGGERNIDFLACAHNTVDQHICDYAGNIGIFINDLGGGFSGNHQINGGYVALIGMPGTDDGKGNRIASTAILIRNNVANAQNTGNQISGVQALTYTDQQATASFGILADGIETKGDVYSQVKTRGFTAADIQGITGNNQSAIACMPRSGLANPIMHIDHVISCN